MALSDEVSHLFAAYRLGSRGVEDDLVRAGAEPSQGVGRLPRAIVRRSRYVGSISVDPTGRYLYYVPGAHGGSDRDGTAIVQFDVTTGRKKVIAFLEPFYTKKYGFTLKGTYATAVAATGDKLYVTWNVMPQQSQARLPRLTFQVTYSLSPVAAMAVA